MVFSDGNNNLTLHLAVSVISFNLRAFGSRVLALQVGFKANDKKINNY